MLKIDSEVLSYNFNFYLKIKKEYRITCSDQVNTIWHSNNYDFYPYMTITNNLSLISIRTTSNTPKEKNTKSIALLLHQINYKSGVTKVTIDLANALSDAGYNVTLIALVLKKSANLFPVSKKINFNYIMNYTQNTSEYVPKNAYSHTEVLSEYFQSQLSDYFAQSTFNLLYTPIYGPFLFSSILECIPATMLKIIADHSSRRYMNYESILNNKINPTLEVMNQYTNDSYYFNNLHKADAIHIINPLVAPIFRQFSQKNVLDIPNIVSVNDQTTKPLFERDKKIILVGSLSKVKNFDTVILAFGKIVLKYSDWSLEIYGKGSDEEVLKELIIKEDLEESVHLKGFTSNIHDVYKNAMIHLSASHKESFGLTMVEAMSNSILTASTKKTIGARYLIEDEKTGFLAPDNTVDDIFTLLSKIISMIETKNPKLTSILENAYKHSQKFNADNISKEWIQAIENLTKKH
jgi:glycosyltransferase involved in cell wall biosynthesis